MSSVSFPSKADISAASAFDPFRTFRSLQGDTVSSVFLSYDHEDRARAAPIAAALEKAGHSVWWDERISAGAEYNEEIEGAVERADAVVVLWSERSVRSAWVAEQ